MIFNVNSGAGKIPVNVVPDTNSSFTYDGNEKTPAWQNYDAEQLTISGNTSATNAGTYTVYFTPKADYEWWDGTSTPKEVTWSIAKASGSLSLSASSGKIEGKKNTKTFTVTRAGDGKISVKSSNTSVATVKLSGTTVTITSVAYGTATITVSVAEGTNHKAPSNKTYSVTVDYLYLYNSGNENTAVTGSWISVGKAMGNWEGARGVGTPVLTKNSDNMVFSVSSNGNGAMFYTKNKINLANYTTLHLECTLNTPNAVGKQNWHNLNIWTSIGTYYTDNRAATTDLHGTGNATRTIDVSNLNSSYYIGFSAFTKETVTVKKLWLE